MNIGELLKKGLDLVPLNGSKTGIGAVIVGAAAALSQLGIDPVQLAKEAIAHPTPIGIGILVLGTVHKVLKAKYPNA